MNDSPFRILNEFVGWWFSCFTNKSMSWPTSAESRGYRRKGVGDR